MDTIHYDFFADVSRVFDVIVSPCGPGPEARPVDDICIVRFDKDTNSFFHLMPPLVQDPAHPWGNI